VSEVYAVYTILAYASGFQLRRVSNSVTSACKFWRASGLLALSLLFGPVFLQKTFQDEHAVVEIYSTISNPDMI